MKNNDLKRWVQAFVQWLKRFRSRRRTKRTTLLEETFTDYAALYRFRDESVPGCVEVWKIVYRGAAGDLLLTLVDVALLRQETAGSQPRAFRISRPQPWQSDFSRDLEASLEAQSDVDATHYWIVSWLKPKRKIDAKGRAYTAPSAELVGVWACDFQGPLGTIAGNRYACHLSSYFAKRIANWEPSKLNTWDEFVAAIPWQKWLEFYSQQIIGSGHELQPLRKRRK